MMTIDEATVARILTPALARELMRATLVAAARGDARNPVRTVIAGSEGWFATMPAAVTLDGSTALGAKLVTAHPGNAARGLATHQATVVLLDPQSGALRALVAGDALTERRTAAVSVVATERLAARPRGTLALLGAGAQARAHLEAFADAGLVTEASIWSRSRAHAERLAAEAARRGIAARAAATPREALGRADVIVTATGSAGPLFDASEVPDGAHLNAVGACVPDRRELPSELVAEANVYVDDSAAAAREAGDLLLAARDLGEDRVRVRAELGAMLLEAERRDPEARITIFESLGLGLEDVACAARVYAVLSGTRAG